MACGSSVVAGSAGTVDSHAGARRPACESTGAQALGNNVGRSTRSRKCRFRVRVVCDCQPCGQSPRPVSCRRGWRIPSAASRQCVHLFSPALGLQEGASFCRTLPSARPMTPGQHPGAAPARNAHGLSRHLYLHRLAARIGTGAWLD